ncbi:Mrp/NBP35 family ATP-binding protein [Pseudothermotoga thermarum]|uniref:Iron-sulfur cluster carrier protein n=1 Tax=Pseudothermotoga thermarum DSM 5069 TaxID=688269 RepID=F7YU55_9THEM|nr:ATPase-like, ParA/MinD [Pseudothermotoga thermarum DSM 5069]
MDLNERLNKVKEREKRITENMSKIKYKIAVLSGKGGVGKTTISVNLAVGLMEEGFLVGLLDLDLHGPNIVRMLGIKENPTIENSLIKPPTYLKNMKVMSMAMLLEESQPLAWRGPMKHSVIQQFLADTDWGELDFLIFDLPPGTGDEALSLFQLVKMDGIVLVTTPQKVAIDDVSRAMNFAIEMNQKVLGLIINMSYLICPQCKTKIDLFGENAAKDFAELVGIDVLGEIPMDPAIAKLADAGKPVVSFLRGSEVEKSFRAVIGTMLEKLGKVSTGG